MAYQPSWQPFRLSKEDVGIPDYAKALSQGYQTAADRYKPATAASDLLNKMLEAKYNQFKAGPDYQSAMLEFLRGQGAHMRGQTENLPSERNLRNAQANEINQKSGIEGQKLDLLRQWMNPDSVPSKNAKNVNYEKPSVAGDIYNQGYEPIEGDTYNDGYKNSSYEGGYTNVDQPSSNKQDFNAGNQAYQKELAMASILGFKEPATFVDPKTGMAYARLRTGTVPIGKEFSEAEKSAASEVGKAKGIEEATFTGESPGDRQLVKDVTNGMDKINSGEWDSLLGWKHRLPYGLNTKLNPKQIGQFAAFEKSLNNLKIKQQSLLAKGQGHITDFSRSLLNSTFPDINTNPDAFKGQLNQFVKDLHQKTFESKQIRKYEKEGMNFDDARDAAQKDSDELFPDIASPSPQNPSQSGFKNADYQQPNELAEISQAAGPQSMQKSGFLEEAKKYAPLAGDITASSLLSVPNNYAKGLGGLMAAGIGAYQASPGHRIQGAIQNVALDAVPGYAGKLIKSAAGKGVAKNTIKATEKLFESRVKPFEEVVAKANKLGDMKAPQNLAATKNKLATSLAGHQQNWTKQLQDMSKFGNKPNFGNAQKAQSALGQIERADVEEPVRAAARDMRKRILGSMQTFLAQSGDSELLPEYAKAMKNYAKSGPMLNDLAAKAKDMSAKDFAAHVKSLSKKGGLPEDLSDLSKSIRRSQSVGNFSKEALKALAPGIAPAGALGGAELLKSLFRGI